MASLLAEACQAHPKMILGSRLVRPPSKLLAKHPGGKESPLEAITTLQGGFRKDAFHYISESFENHFLHHRRLRQQRPTPDGLIGLRAGANVA